MKKLLVVLLAVAMLVATAGCMDIGGLISGLEQGTPAGVTNTKNPALIGTWKLDTTAENSGEESGENSLDIEFGLGIEFTKDGKLRYGFTEDVFESLQSGVDMEEAINGMEFLVTIYYEVKSDTELDITISAIMGLAKETQTVEYSLKGDTLVFEGATYTRVK